jgi:hypothetical protein
MAGLNSPSLTVGALFSVLRHPTLAHSYPSTALRTSLASGFLPLLSLSQG